MCSCVAPRLFSLLLYRATRRCVLAYRALEFYLCSRSCKKRDSANSVNSDEFCFGKLGLAQGSGSDLRCDRHGCKLDLRVVTSTL